MHKLHRGLGLAAVCALSTCCVAVAQTDALTSAAKVFSSPAYLPATIGIAVLDATSGDILFEQNAGTALLPASSMKAITTAAAMHYLGPERRFTTSLYASGSIANQTLSGDLVIEGSGDPTFGSNRVPSSETSVSIFARWTDAVRAAGIRTITGSLIIDDSYFGNQTLPGGYEWEDIGNYYATGVNGLNFRDNFFELILKSGESLGAPVQILGTEPNLPMHIEWMNDLLTSSSGSGDQATIYSAPGSSVYRVSGTIPLGGEMRIKASMHDPGQVFAALLQDSLTSAGIKISGKPRKGTVSSRDVATSRCLANVVSPTVAEIVTLTNMQSFNLYAESLQMQIGKLASGNTRDGAISAELAYLRSLGVPLAGYHIRDGSGLSRGSTITARGMATLCQKLQPEPWFSQWQDSLPVMGTSGDLRDRSKDSPLKGRVRGKTGLITRVRGLCGYLDAKSGRKLTFAVHVNGYENSWQSVDADIDTFLTAVYDSY